MVLISKHLGIGIFRAKTVLGGNARHADLDDSGDSGTPGGLFEVENPYYYSGTKCSGTERSDLSGGPACQPGTG
jgi:hypothetical protein